MMRKLWIPHISWGLFIEITLWAILAILFPYRHYIASYFPGYKWLIDHPQLFNMLPRCWNMGYGSLSFITVATGFNVALVKFEMLRKSLVDLDNEWASRVDDRIQSENLGDYLADDKFIKHLNDRKKHHQGEISASNKKCWLKGRCWALRMMVLGSIFLFYQTSGGILVLLLIMPAIYTWIVKVQYTSALDDKINSMIQELQTFAAAWDILAKTARQEIGSGLKAMDVQ